MASLDEAFWRFEENLVGEDGEERDEVMRVWMGALSSITGDLRKQAAEGTREGIGAVPWAWRPETESQLRREGATESQLGRRAEELTGDLTALS